MGTLTNGTVKLPSDINTLKAALYQHTCKILASSKYYPLSLLGGWGDAGDWGEEDSFNWWLAKVFMCLCLCGGVEVK